nr:hypothetical protein CFP56_44455 [Quercus suber]
MPMLVSYPLVLQQGQHYADTNSRASASPREARPTGKAKASSRLIHGHQSAWRTSVTHDESSCTSPEHDCDLETKNGEDCRLPDAPANEYGNPNEDRVQGLAWHSWLQQAEDAEFVKEGPREDRIYRNKRIAQVTLHLGTSGSEQASGRLRASSRLSAAGVADVR